MRFMMIVKGNKNSEAGVMPSEELIATMGRYNEELSKAGVLVDLSGLQPTSKGFRVSSQAESGQSWTDRSPKARKSSPGIG